MRTKKLAIVLLFVLLFVCGCGTSGGSLAVYDSLGVSPAFHYRPIQLYTPEHRIENLERNAREMEIGRRFPSIAARSSY